MLRLSVIQEAISDEFRPVKDALAKGAVSNNFRVVGYGSFNPFGLVAVVIIINRWGNS